MVPSVPVVKRDTAPSVDSLTSPAGPPATPALQFPTPAANLPSPAVPPAPPAPKRQAPVVKPTKTTDELATWTRDQALSALARLREGYKNKSGAAYGPTATNTAGCVLVQKAPSRQENGYVQIAPIVEVRTRAKSGGPLKKKMLPQNAHRLAVLAYRSEEDIRRMLAREHASHLCHQPTCVRAEHIVVETKEANEARKKCKALGPIVRTIFEGREIELPPNGQCLCEGEKCVFVIETRESRLLKYLLRGAYIG